MKITNFAALIILALPLIACGTGVGFNSAGKASTQSALSGVANNQIITANGDISWNTSSVGNSSAPDTQYSFTLKIPFGTVYQVAAHVTQIVAPYTCQPVSGITNSSAASYNAGEIPCGQIVNSDWKQLLDISVPEYATSASGFNVSVNPLSFPVLLSRATNQGNYTEDSLDSKSNVTQLSSKTFGNDISIEYTPNGTNTALQMCINIPGSAITTNTETITVKASKYILFGTVSDSTNLTITPGQASFDYGRGCFAVNFGWSGGALSPTVSFAATQAPYLSNTNYSGLQIKIDSWWLNLLNNILAFFNLNIKQKVVNMTMADANSIADGDVETGKWFTMIHGQALLNNAGSQINHSISSVLTRIGIPSTTSDLTTMLQDDCRLLKFTPNSNWTTRLDTFCSQIVTNVQISVQPFYADPASQAAGCYNHFARINATTDATGNPKWWANQCQFASQFSITLPHQYADYITELQQLLALQISPSRIPQAWLSDLNNLGVDSFTLNLLLAELESQGYKQITASDFQNSIPEIVAALKAKFGTSL